MSDDMQDTAISASVELFVHGAKTLHVGYYLDVRKLEEKGIEIIGQALRAIDSASPSGRDPLLALLDHPEEGVRTVAAGGLWQSHPNLAIPVLKDVDRHGITEASGLALKILMFYGRLNPCPSDPRYEHLKEDENGVYAWDDPAFRSRVLEGRAPSVFALRKPKPDVVPPVR